MAVSGSYNTNTIAGSSTTGGLTFSWSRTSFSVENNTSTISWTLKGRITKGVWIKGQNFNQTVNGVNYSKSENIELRQGTLVLSGTLVIPHDTNGNKTFSANTVADIYYYGTGNTTGSGTWALDSIPRASTIKTFNPFTIGNNISWEVDRKYSANTHKVELLFGGQVIASENTSNASGTLSIDLTAKNKMLGLVPNAASGQATLRVTTYTNANYNVQVGTPQTKVVTATVGSEIQPDFTSISHSENVSSVQSLVGAYVKDKSRLNLAIVGAKAGEGSTISSYTITVAGQTINAVSGVTGLINRSGTLPIVAKVTDRRGRTVTATIDIEVLDYSPPTIENVSFVRCDSSGTIDPLGAYAKVTFKATSSTLNVSSVEKNKLQYKIKSKQTNESTYDTKTDVNHETLTYTGSTLLSGYLADFSYNFQIEVNDVFSEVSLVAGLIPNGILLMQWYRDTVSIGMMMPSDEYNLFVGSKGMKSNGPIIDKNGVEVLGANDYVIETGENENGKWEKWESGKLVQRGRTTVSNVAIDKLWGNMYFYNNLTVYNYPIPFIEPPHHENNVRSGSSTSFIPFSYSAPNITNSTFYGGADVLRPTVGNGAVIINDWVATGRWK